MRRALILLIAVAATVAAQKYPFKHYGREQGLTNLTPQCMLQDRTGFLWIGTQNGLFQYDGARFVHYSVNDGLPGSGIDALHESVDGTLWVGTTLGLARRVETPGGSRFEPVKVTAGRDVVRPRGITSKPDGTLFVGLTEGLAIGRFSFSSPGAINFKVIQPSGRSEPARGLHLDPAGTLWFWCGARLCKFERGEAAIVTPALDNASSRGGDTLTDREGNLWARASQKLLVRRTGAGANRFEEVEGVYQSDDFSSLALDSQGRLLVPTDLGVTRLDRGGTWTRIGKENGLATDSASFTYQDREGSIWIGLGGGGLAKWIGYGQWENWAGSQGPGNDNIWGIARDRAGTIWVTTDVGVHYAETNAAGKAGWKQWKTGIPTGRIYFVRAARDGAVWVGGVGALLARIDPATRSVTRFGAAQGFTAPGLMQGAFDHSGSLWIATQKGLFRTDPNPGANARFTRAVIPGEAPDTPYEVLLAARDGTFWVGGARGAFRLHNGEWRKFSEKNGLKPDRVARLAQTNDGALWIGYRGAFGLTRLAFESQTPGLPERTEARHFTVQDGLHSDQPISLGSDARGRLWYCTDNGVEVLEGETWRRYGYNDGLVWDDSNGNAFLAEPDGSVWIGTSGGLSHFAPGTEARMVPKAPPPVVNVSLAGASPNGAEEIRIPYGTSFTINYTALSFVNEAAIRFRHRLSGAESAWIVTSAREAHYAGLPPGDYRFEVQAREGDGPWSPPAAVAFQIAAPWWRTGPAMFFAGIALLGLVRIAWRWRMQTMLETQRQLEAAVAERTVEIERLLEEARQATTYKSQFLANMSHEIRTPMNGILGLTELTLHDELTPEQKTNLSLVQSSAQGLLTIINDILDFSKVEAGKLELQRVSFSLRDQIDGVLKLIKVRAAEKELLIVSNVDEQLPDRLLGDPFRLRQILLNLLGNAVKFTDRGSVTLTVRGALKDTGRIELQTSVADTGIGIAKDKIDAVFEAFQQEEGSIARRFGGTGLGLAIVRQLVTLMGGRIWVESEIGKGSIFLFSVQLDLAPAYQPGNTGIHRVGTGSAAQSARILVAEDNPVNQRLIQRLLERRGYGVTLTADGAAAAKMFDQESFDLILMDVHMPGMDGFAATRVIRERERERALRRTPIIALTADALVGDRERCLDAGMDDYVSKPINTNELYRAIEELRAQTLPSS